MIPGAVRWCSICQKAPASWNFVADIEGQLVPLQACNECFETKVNKVGPQASKVLTDTR